MKKEISYLKSLELLYSELEKKKNSKINSTKYKSLEKELNLIIQDLQKPLLKNKNKHSDKINSKQDYLNELYKDIELFKSKASIPSISNDIIISPKAIDPEIVLVSDSPTEEDYKNKMSMSGEYGNKIKQIIKAMNISEKEFHFSHIMKYKAEKENSKLQTKENRKSNIFKLKQFLGFFWKEINIINPKVMIILGANPAEAILEKSSSITDLRKNINQINSIPTVVTYSPEFLIKIEKSNNLEKIKNIKRLIWEDMLKVLNILNKPISEKQKNYFK